MTPTEATFDLYSCRTTVGLNLSSRVRATESPEATRDEPPPKAEVTLAWPVASVIASARQLIRRARSLTQIRPKPISSFIVGAFSRGRRPMRIFRCRERCVRVSQRSDELIPNSLWGGTFDHLLCGSRPGVTGAHFTRTGSRNITKNKRNIRLHLFSSTISH